MKLTYSRISAWKQCPKRYWFEYVEGLEPTVKPWALWFGGLVHRGLEHLFRDGSEGLLACLQTYVAENPHPKADEFALKTAYAMLYKFWLRNPLDQLGHMVVSREFHFDLPLGDTTFEAVIDLVTQDRNGNIWLWEHKTCSHFPDPEWLRIEDQSAYYLWAYKQHTGQDPIGVVYNMLRKPSIKPRNGESDGDWLERLGRDMDKRPEFYFRLDLIHKDPRQIEEIGMELEELAQVVGRPPFYRNPNACKHWGCVYREVCILDAPVTRASYKRKEVLDVV